MLSKNRRTPRRWLSAALGVVCTLVAAGAHANPDFPGLLAKNVPMPCVPLCTLCHNTRAGGPLNIRMHSMGTTWTMFGLVGADPSSLVPALMAAKSEMQDTDGDGIPDVEELQMGTDPDDPAMGATVCIAGPVYGCARVAPQGHVDNVAAGAGALVALFGMAAFRRRVMRSRVGAKK